LISHSKSFVAKEARGYHQKERKKERKKEKERKKKRDDKKEKI
jgi:hypothetical protein